MSEAPERIWIEDERPDGGSCHVYNAPTPGVLKYAVEDDRADTLQAQLDAAVKAERERCAKRFANHDCIRMKEYAYGWRHDVYDAIRKGDQP